MIDREEILSMLEELLPQLEEDKSEEEIRHIIRRFLIEKGITQHLTENQIRAICWQFLLDEGIIVPPSGGDDTPSVDKLFPTLVINSTSTNRKIIVGGSQTYSISVDSDGELTVATSNANIATVIKNNGSITVTGVSNGSATISLTSSETANYYPAQISIVVNVGAGVRYGVKIAKNTSDPATRVQYIYDAENMAPAYMNYDTEVFDYGDWADKWFITDNKPLMLGYDGVVDYYLDPDDYSKKIDGTPSDVANVDYHGNAMAQIPLVWVYRYEDENYEYEIISNVQYDENYKAYAHTRADGSIADYFYVSMFFPHYDGVRVKSISNQSFNYSYNMSCSTLRGWATANGNNYDVMSWSQKELLRTLLVIMGKSTDTQNRFGLYGGYSGGSLDTKGRFWGKDVRYGQKSKIFHSDVFWSDYFIFLLGIVLYDNKIYVKMTPEGDGYSLDNVNGYTNPNDIGVLPSGYIKAVFCSEYGAIPISNGASNSTFYCDNCNCNSSGYLGPFQFGSYKISTSDGSDFRLGGAYSLQQFIETPRCLLSCFPPAA